MPDWPLIAVRFALYLDLGLAFGWPLFSLYASRGAEDGTAVAPPTLLLGVLGLVFSGLGFLLMIAAMAGTDIGQVDPELVRVMVRETALGWAFLVRMAALLLLVVAAVASRRARMPALMLAIGSGAVALASLAWNGHAAATEGGLAAVHLAADVLHLWAAGLWVGALFGLSAMLMRRRLEPPQLGAAHRALHGFSTIGTVAVATLVVTGVVNTLALAGGVPIADAAGSRWGQLLLLKLLLFGAMLAFAAANRFRLTPDLERAIALGDTRRAAAALRLSLCLETAGAVSILALVGWLGTLATPAAG